MGLISKITEAIAGKKIPPKVQTETKKTSIIPNSVPIVQCKYYDVIRNRKYNMEVNSKIFSQKDIDAMKKLAKRQNCDFEALKATILFESGGQTNKSNSVGASGIIQFTPANAKWLGTTVEDLKKMSFGQQLNYVEKHLEKTKKIAGIKENEYIDKSTLYGLIFCPARAKGSGDKVLYSKGYNTYEKNKALDLNGDGKITKEEASSMLNRFYTCNPVVV